MIEENQDSFGWMVPARKYQDTGQDAFRKSGDALDQSLRSSGDWKPEWDIEEEPEGLTEPGEKKTLGWSDAWSGGFGDILGDITPFVSGVKELAESKGLWEAADRVKKDTATEEDFKMIQAFMEEASADKTVGYHIGSILRQLPAFGIEMWAGVGLATKATKAAAKLGIESLQVGLEKTIKQKSMESIARNQLAQAAALEAAGDATAGGIKRKAAEGVLKEVIKTSPWKAVKEAGKLATASTAGSEAITSVAGGLAGQGWGGRSQADAYRRAFQKSGMYMDRDEAGNLSLEFAGSLETFWDSLPAGIANTFVEHVTERMGGTLMRMPLVNRLEGFQASIAAKFMGKHHMKPAELIRHLDKFGWDGPIEEFLEERLGSATRALTFVGEDEWLVGEGKDGYYIKTDQLFPDWRQWAGELSAFAIAGQGASALHGYFSGEIDPLANARAGRMGAEIETASFRRIFETKLAETPDPETKEPLGEEAVARFRNGQAGMAEYEKIADIINREENGGLREAATDAGIRGFRERPKTIGSQHQEVADRWVKDSGGAEGERAEIVMPSTSYQRQIVEQFKDYADVVFVQGGAAFESGQTARWSSDQKDEEATHTRGTVYINAGLREDTADEGALTLLKKAFHETTHEYQWLDEKHRKVAFDSLFEEDSSLVDSTRLEYFSPFILRERMTTVKEEGVEGEEGWSKETVEGDWSPEFFVMSQEEKLKEVDRYIKEIWGPKKRAAGKDPKVEERAELEAALAEEYTELIEFLNIDNGKEYIDKLKERDPRVIERIRDFFVKQMNRFRADDKQISTGVDARMDRLEKQIMGVRSNSDSFEIAARFNEAMNILGSSAGRSIAASEEDERRAAQQAASVSDENVELSEEMFPEGETPDVGLSAEQWNELTPEEQQELLEKSDLLASSSDIAEFYRKAEEKEAELRAGLGIEAETVDDSVPEDRPLTLGDKAVKPLKRLSRPLLNQLAIRENLFSGKQLANWGERNTDTFIKKDQLALKIANKQRERSKATPEQHDPETQRLMLELLDPENRTTREAAPQVVYTDDVRRPPGRKDLGAAWYDPIKKIVYVNKEAARKKYEEKAWTKPKLAGVIPLADDTFDSYEEWEQWLIDHETYHSTQPRKGQFPANAEFENRANEYATKQIDLHRQNVGRYGVPSQKPLPDPKGELTPSGALLPEEEQELAQTGAPQALQPKRAGVMLPKMEGQLAEYQKRKVALSPLKVISGMQHGADRTVLEEAGDFGLETGGTAPKGFKTIKGDDPLFGNQYGLTEDASTDYGPRTEANVKQSTGTLLLGDVNSTGSAQTIRFAKKHKKPIIINPSVEEFAQWMKDNNIRVLNGAGNRDYKDRDNVRNLMQAAKTLSESKSDERAAVDSAIAEIEKDIADVKERRSAATAANLSEIHPEGSDKEVQEGYHGVGLSKTGDQGKVTEYLLGPYATPEEAAEALVEQETFIFGRTSLEVIGSEGEPLSNDQRREMRAIPQRDQDAYHRLANEAHDSSYPVYVTLKEFEVAMRNRYGEDWEDKMTDGQKGVHDSILRDLSAVIGGRGFNRLKSSGPVELDIDQFIGWVNKINAVLYAQEQYDQPVEQRTGDWEGEKDYREFRKLAADVERGRLSSKLPLKLGERGKFLAHDQPSPTLAPLSQMDQRREEDEEEYEDRKLYTGYQDAFKKSFSNEELDALTKAYAKKKNDAKRSKNAEAVVQKRLVPGKRLDEEGSPKRYLDKTLAEFEAAQTDILSGTPTRYRLHGTSGIEKSTGLVVNRVIHIVKGHELGDMDLVVSKYAGSTLNPDFGEKFETEQYANEDYQAIHRDLAEHYGVSEDELKAALKDFTSQELEDSQADVDTTKETKGLDVIYLHRDEALERVRALDVREQGEDVEPTDLVGTQDPVAEQTQTDRFKTKEAIPGGEPGQYTTNPEDERTKSINLQGSFESEEIPGMPRTDAEGLPIKDKTFFGGASPATQQRTVGEIELDKIRQAKPKDMFGKPIDVPEVPMSVVMSLAHFRDWDWVNNRVVPGLSSKKLHKLDKKLLTADQSKIQVALSREKVAASAKATAERNTLAYMTARVFRDLLNDMSTDLQREDTGAESIEAARRLNLLSEIEGTKEEIGPKGESVRTPTGERRIRNIKEVVRLFGKQPISKYLDYAAEGDIFDSEFLALLDKVGGEPTVADLYAVFKNADQAAKNLSRIAREANNPKDITARFGVGSDMIREAKESEWRYTYVVSGKGMRGGSLPVGQFISRFTEDGGSAISQGARSIPIDAQLAEDIRGILGTKTKELEDFDRMQEIASTTGIARLTESEAAELEKQGYKMRPLDGMKERHFGPNPFSTLMYGSSGNNREYFLKNPNELDTWLVSLLGNLSHAERANKFGGVDLFALSKEERFIRVIQNLEREDRAFADYVLGHFVTSLNPKASALVNTIANLLARHRVHHNEEGYEKMRLAMVGPITPPQEQRRRMRFFTQTGKAMPRSMGESKLRPSYPTGRRVGGPAEQPIIKELPGGVSEVVQGSGKEVVDEYEAEAAEYLSRDAAPQYGDGSFNHYGSDWSKALNRYKERVLNLSPEEREAERQGFAKWLRDEWSKWEARDMTTKYSGSQDRETRLPLTQRPEDVGPSEEEMKEAYKDRPPFVQLEMYTLPSLLSKRRLMEQGSDRDRELRGKIQVIRGLLAEERGLYREAAPQMSPFARKMLQADKDYVRNRRSRWGEALVNRYLPLTEWEQHLEAKGIKIPRHMRLALRQAMKRGELSSEMNRIDRQLFRPLAMIIENTGKKRLGRGIKMSFKDADRISTLKSVQEKHDVLIDRQDPEKPHPMSKMPTGIDPLKALKELAVLERRYGKDHVDALEKAVMKISKETREVWRRSGLVSTRVIDFLEKNYPHYVPYREQEMVELQEWSLQYSPEDVESGTVLREMGNFIDTLTSTREYLGSERGSDMRQPMFRTMLGMTDKPQKYPLLMLMAQLNHAVGKEKDAEISRAVVDLIKLGEDVLGNHNIGVIVPDDERLVKRAVEKDKQIIGKEVLDPRFIDKNPLVYVAAGKDGERVIVEFHPQYAQLAAALKSENMSPSNKHALVEFLGKMTMFIGGMITRWNPAFSVPNFVRDTSTASMHITSEYGAKVASEMFLRPSLISSLKTLMKANKAISDGTYDAELPEFSSDPDMVMFERYRASGAPVTFLDLGKMRGLEDWFKEIHQSYSPPQMNQLQFWKGRVSTIRTYIENFNDAFENATRFAYFKYGIEKGLPSKLVEGENMDEQELAMGAKNLTVNFEQKGTVGASLNSLFMFANANIQSNVRLFDALFSRDKAGKRSLQSHAKGLIASVVTLHAAIAIMNAAIGGIDPDDDEPYWSKIPDWDKRANLILLNWMGQDGKGIKIPLPYGYNVFSAIGNMFGEVWAGTKRGEEVTPFLFETALQAFSPIGGGTDLTDMITPTVVKPLFEIRNNRDWKGSAIYKNRYGDEMIPDSELAFDSVSKRTQAVTDWLNEATGGNRDRAGSLLGVDTSINPASIEHLAQFLGGGIGKELFRVFKIGENISEGEEVAVGDIPLLRRFALAPTKYAAASLYRERRDKIEVVERMRESGISLTGEDKQLYSLSTARKSAENSIKKIRQQRKRHQRGSEEYKKAEERERSVQNAFNKRWNRVFKA